MTGSSLRLILCSANSSLLDNIVTFNGPVGRDAVYGELCKLNDTQFNSLANELQHQLFSVKITFVKYLYILSPPPRVIVQA